MTSKRKMKEKSTSNNLINPDKDCSICPRLKEFRDENRTKFPDYFNAPVPVWGDKNPKLIIVGLAPGLKGANRTGRPFTGDYAGDLLFQTLAKAGLSSGEYKSRANDGLELKNVMIVNAVRCVPPQNKPIGAEINSCRPFLIAAMKSNPSAKVFLALGLVAHNSFLTTIGARKVSYKFAHGAKHVFENGTILFDSYHCSRYNTNTNRLSEKMFEDVVFAAAKEALS